jgi:arylsulfatase A-like enzyme
MRADTWCAVRTDLRPLWLFLAALFAACTPLRSGREDIAPPTLRLVFETARASKLAVTRHALAPRVVATSKGVTWKADGGTVSTAPNGTTSVAATGPFKLTSTLAVTKNVDYIIRAAATAELKITARSALNDKYGAEEALMTKRADGYDFTLGLFAYQTTLDLTITGTGNATIPRFDVKEALLREPIELLNAEDTALRAVVTDGRETDDKREVEALLATGESAYEWPLASSPDERTLDFETFGILRFGDDKEGIQPLEMSVEVRENGAWRKPVTVVRGGPGDDRSSRRGKVSLGHADMLRLATRAPAGAPKDAPTVTVAWGRPIVRPTVRPNLPDVILITLDALRAVDVGAYGSTKGLTPNFDKLGKEGVVFEEARTTRGETWESTTAIAYATWPDDVGVANRGDRVKHGTRGIAEAFANAGYFTARLGNVLVMPGQLGTFDVSTDVFDDIASLKHFQEVMEEEKERPKFIWMHLAMTHYPYNISKEYLPPGAPEHVTLTELHKIVHDAGPPEALAALMARSDAAVHEADVRVGALFPALQDPSRPGGPAIFMLSADHGSMRGEQGIWFMHGTVHRAVLRVPLILSWPGHLQPRRVKALVRTIDYGPTLLDLGPKRPDTFTGKSLAPLARGEPMPPLTNIVKDASAILVVENDEYKAIGAIQAQIGWPQSDLTLKIPDISLFRWRDDPNEEHDLSGDAPLVAGELLSQVTRAGQEEQQSISPEALRLLKQAGYAGDSH